MHINHSVQFRKQAKMKVAQSCLSLCDPMDCTVHGISPGQNTGVGSLSLLQGIFPTQGSNPGLPHCRWILYQLSHKVRPKILEEVVYPFSSGSSLPRNRTRVSYIADRFFTNWAIREASLVAQMVNRPSSAIIEKSLLFYLGCLSFIPLPHSKDLFIFQSLVIENRIISSITPLSDSTASSHSLLPSPPTILWVPKGRDQALIFVKLTSSQGGSTEKVGLPITLFNHRFIFIYLIFEFPHKILFPEVVWLKPLCKTAAAWLYQKELFTVELYQTFKELISILSLFPEIEEEGTHWYKIPQQKLATWIGRIIDHDQVEFVLRVQCSLTYKNQSK